ncbi:MAG TPA: TolC family protein [Steroidobacteraceae bacterium]|nr:TolC family protein [Steroidobacteraceae bacterium]
MGPDYRKPFITLEGFRSAAAVQARIMSTSAPALDRWWLGFDDPELTRIIERALHQNLDLAAAIARVEQARAAAREAGAQLLPTADLTVQAARTHESLESPIGAIARQLPGFQRDQFESDVGAGASWEIDLFGGLRRGAQAATAEAQAAEAEQVGTHIMVAADAADAYLQVRGDQARIAVARDEVTTDERLVELIECLFRSGLATDREVAQAQALLSQARASLQPLAIDAEAQLNRLDVLMGAQPGSYAAELKSPQRIPPAPAIPSDDTPANVLRRRPDVIAAERRLVASNARVGQAISEYYPKISIAGLLGFESLSTDHLFRAATFQPEALAGLRWRLFDFGKINAEVAQAKGANAEALADYRQSILHAVEEAYAAGVIPLTDVLDADRQLLAAQDQLTLTRANTDQAAVQSFRAIGGGWGS